MSGSGDGNGPNRTVFRPSPLQQAGAAAAPPPPPAARGWDAPAPPPPAPAYAPPPAAAFAPPPQPYAPAPPQAYAAAPVQAARLGEDDIPPPRTPQAHRNRLMAAASPALALAASVRSGRARIVLPELHRQISTAIGTFDRVIAGEYPEEARMRAKYALCATVDDIVQNLPGIGADGTEWARRSMVVTFFQENIGGDRFWQLVREMVARPTQNAELIELYHACLAAGFEGKYRVIANGKRGLHEEMAALYGAMEHPRSLSSTQLVDHWEGSKVPLRKVGLWSYLLLAAGVAAAVLLLVYIALQLLLSASGGPSAQAVAQIAPDDPLRLSRAATAPPPAPASGQVAGLRQFLAPEIRDHLVTVEEDASTVRVRTTIGELFKSGSDQLEPGKQELFEKIGRAVEREQGKITIEGHADSAPSHSLAFPDNQALSSARAQTVASIVSGQVSDQARISAIGYGDSRPLASNATAEGKSQNRRVEIVVPRRN